MDEEQTACIKAKDAKKEGEEEMKKPEDIKYDNDSGIQRHAADNDHSFNFEAVKILEHEKVLHKRKVLEAIHIMLSPNPCNDSKGGVKLHSSWNSIIRYFEEGICNNNK